jgi:putative DNA primase/helicase
MRELVEAVLKENHKKEREAKAEEQRREKCMAKHRANKQREEDRKRREQEREQERADKEAAKKERGKEKAFAALIKLPKAEHEKQLIELAKRLDEDLKLLKDEFKEFADSEEEGPDIGDVEPWPDPVDTKALLTELMTQLKRYVVVHDDASVAIVLWVMFAWVHSIAVHSPYLVFVSAEGDCGKTTACDMVKFLSPRGHSGTELTAASIYRFVDRVRPTLIIDDADTLFKRKPDLVTIVNAAWTRGTKIPRQGPGSLTYWFDPFCPKVIAGVKLALLRTTMTRTIAVKMVPKLPEEKVEDFDHVDDDTFLTLRRKLTRWAADNVEALKGARPVLPPGFTNRLRMNWLLQLVIADLAGGDWPKLARRAAIRLARERREVSEGVRVLEAFRTLFATYGPILTSAEVQGLLTADSNSEWVDFRGHGPISQRQIAVLLDPYDVHPGVIHPQGRKADRGYKAEWFADAFARYLRPTARKRTSVSKPRGKPRK